MVMAARVRLCTGASAVLAGALLAHSRSLQEPMEGPVKVLGRILQEPRADQAKALCRNLRVLMAVQEMAVDHILPAQRVVPARAVYRNLEPTDFVHILQDLGHPIDRVDLVADSHYRSRSQVEVVPALVYTLQLSHRHRLPLPLLPSEYPLCRSLPCLYQGLDHKARLCHILEVDRILLFPYHAALENSSSHRNIDFAISAVPTDLFLYQQEALDRKHSKVVGDCRIHPWVRCIHRDPRVHLASPPVLLSLALRICCIRRPSSLPGCWACSVVFY